MSAPATHGPQDATGTGVRVCLCTCPDLAGAEALAVALVEDGLAACVKLLPGVLSVYRWDGRTERAQEVQLIMKTTVERLPALMDQVRASHPYACPELIALEAVAGLPGYLDWVRDHCARTDTGP